MPDEPDLIDQFFLKAHPNPGRTGCPGKDTLKAIARKTLPLKNPAWSHLASCSPCFREVQKLKEAHRASGLNFKKKLVLAAAGLMVCVTVAYYVFAPPTFGPLLKQDIALDVDLQHWRVFRSDTPGKERGPLVFPRQRLDLTFSLPVGSEDGPYDVQISMNPEGPALVSGHGIARLEDHTETLRTRLDVSSLPPAIYSLEIRHPGAGALRVPIKVTVGGNP